MIASLTDALNRASRRRLTFVRQGPELYRHDEGGRWVTIGGTEKDGEKHHGGTPVKVSPSGTITAGPPGLEGREVDDLASKRKPPEPERWALQHPKNKPSGPRDRAGTLFDKRATPAWAGGPEEGTPASTPAEAPTMAAAAPAAAGPPAGVRQTADGRWVGSTVVHVGDLNIDSDRFQYKISNIDPTTGTTAELKGVKRYNPDFGGQLLVWRDPADGKTYVINGHHRAELAMRSEHWEADDHGPGWHGEMAVRYLPAQTANEARAVGALANIAEGRGTSTDAAKFLRDVKGGAEQLAQYGVSLRGKVAVDAVVLSKLAPDVFHDMALGLIEESRGLAIARHLEDPDLQSKLHRMVKDRERKDGRAVPDAHVAEMAREMALAGKTKVGGGGGGLFGDDDHEESLVFQRAELKAALRRELTQERNTFKAVSSSGRVKRISGAGANQLDVDTNRSRAQQADEALFVFDRLANSRGELSNAIQQHATELYHTPGKRNKILASLKARALEILEREGSGDGGLPAGGAAESSVADRQPATLGFSRAAATGSHSYAPAREPGGLTADSLVLAFSHAFSSIVERYARPRYAANQRSLLWNETEHPRSQTGQFSAKGSSIGGHSAPRTAHTVTPAAQDAEPPTATPPTAATPGDLVSQLKEAFARKAREAETRQLAPATAPLPGQRDLFDAAYDVPLTAPPPRASKARFETTPTVRPTAPKIQQNLFHGLKDLPGQKKLFEGMDLGGAAAPAEEDPEPSLAGLFREEFRARR